MQIYTYIYIYIYIYIRQIIRWEDEYYQLSDNLINI